VGWIDMVLSRRRAKKKKKKAGDIDGSAMRQEALFAIVACDASVQETGVSQHKPNRVDSSQALSRL
jgi:hypothetical protein